MSSTQLPKQEYQGDNQELSKDTVYQILSNNRRRLVLQFIDAETTENEAVNLRDISEYIAGQENNIPTAEITYKQRKRVHTSLYQSHLPKLHKDGIINYNKRDGTVAPTPRTAEFVRHIKNDSSSQQRWAQYWVVLGLVAVVVTGLAWLGTIPVAEANRPVVGVLISFIILFSALIHMGGVRQ